MDFMFQVIDSVVLTPLYLVLIITTAVTMFSIITLHTINLRRTYWQKVIYIEIVPPLDIDKTPRATEQLFHMLHTIGSTRKLRRRIQRHHVLFSFEVVSSRNEGVRYIVRVGEREADAVERSIIAFLPSAQIRRVSDPLVAESKYSLVKEFRQTKHYALPIRTLDTFEQHDPIAYITGAMNRLNDGEQVALQLILSPTRMRNMQTIVRRFFEYHKVSDATHNKAYGHLYRSELRIYATSQKKEVVDERIRGMEAAIASFSIPKVQTLKARYNFPRALCGQYRKWAFINRMPSLIPGKSSIFSSLELAHFYHFPARDTTTEGLVTSLSRTLAPPLSLRANKGFDLVLGRTNYYGEKADIGLSQAERQRHVYILGGTGNGKTTMMQGAIIQDIKDGKGVAVLDPHGDMAEFLIEHIPEDRIKDVVYFNPDDIDHPFALNMLEIPEGLDGNDLLRQKDLVTETVVSIFRKIFSEGNGGGTRIEAALRNTIQTALTLENPTIFTLYRLINDPRFRKKVVANLEDESLKNYWINEIGEAGGMQRVKMMAGITTKIGRFLFSASAKRILDHPKSTIDFTDIVDSKKILICNLSKGLLGEDTSELFGIMVIAKLQMAAYQRARQKQSERIPFYIYVDEFQNFATPSFIEMLAEARKYKLFLVMAEQTTSQQARDMVNVILANVGTVVCFRSGNPADEQLVLPIFSPFIESGEITNLPAFNFYARIAAIKPQEPVSGETIVVEDTGDVEIARRVIASSRKLYARDYPPVSTLIKESLPPSVARKTKNAISADDI
jgi:uncharacterized protein DUF87/type IV secretory system conjugative DNA transfer VirD4/TraG family protein